MRFTLFTGNTCEWQLHFVENIALIFEKPRNGNAASNVRIQKDAFIYSFIFINLAGRPFTQMHGQKLDYRGACNEEALRFPFGGSQRQLDQTLRTAAIGYRLEIYLAEGQSSRRLCLLDDLGQEK